MKIQRPKLRSKRGQNAAKRERTDLARQGAPRAARGGTHGPWWWDARLCALHARPCVPWCARLLRVFRVFFVPLRLPTVFATFCLYIADVSKPNSYPNSSHSNLHLHSQIRLVLERERGSGEELRGIRCRASIERLRIDNWMSNFFSFSSLFSSLVYVQ